MNNITPAAPLGEPTQIYQLRACDLESVVRKIIKEEADRREEAREEYHLTASEVAVRLRVNPSTLYRWRKNGKLKGVKIGQEFLYRETDVDQMLRGGRRL